jgi:hypothetical protein
VEGNTGRGLRRVKFLLAGKVFEFLTRMTIFLVASRQAVSMSTPSLSPGLTGYQALHLMQPQRNFVTAIQWNTGKCHPGAEAGLASTGKG